MNNDPRYEQLKSEEKIAQQKAVDVTSGLAKQSETMATEQNQFLDDYQRGQQELLGRSVERETQALERTKAEQEKGFQKEAGAAFTDYTKFTNQYGVEAEKQAMEGVTGTGFSETSKVRAYGEYQRRYATARDTMEKNKMAADIAIGDAKLKGDIQAAQIAFETYQQKVANTLRSFEYTSSLALQQLNINREISQQFYGRSQDLLAQTNLEKQQQYQREQDKLSQTNWQKEFDALQRERNRSFSLAKSKATETSLPITDSITGEVVNGTELMPRVNSFFKYYKNDFKTVEEATSWLQKSGYNTDERRQILEELIRRG